MYHYGLLDLKGTLIYPYLGTNREFKGLIAHSGMLGFQVRVIQAQTCNVNNHEEIAQSLK